MALPPLALLVLWALLLPSMPFALEVAPLGLSRSRALERERDRVRTPAAPPPPLRESSFGSRVLERDEGGRSLVYWFLPVRRAGFAGFMGAADEALYTLRAVLRCDERGGGTSIAGGVETLEVGGG